MGLFTYTGNVYALTNYILETLEVRIGQFGKKLIFIFLKQNSLL